jgi:hypothetical protein
VPYQYIIPTASSREDAKNRMKQFISKHEPPYIAFMITLTKEVK